VRARLPAYGHPHEAQQCADNRACHQAHQPPAGLAGGELRQPAENRAYRRHDYDVEYKTQDPPAPSNSFSCLWA